MYSSLRHFEQLLLITSYQDGLERVAIYVSDGVVLLETSKKKLLRNLSTESIFYLYQKELYLIEILRRQMQLAQGCSTARVECLYNILQKTNLCFLNNSLLIYKEERVFKKVSLKSLIQMPMNLFIGIKKN